jgi:hypothetical protein
VFMVNYHQTPHLPTSVINFQPECFQRLKYYTINIFYYIYNVLTHFIFSVQFGSVLLERYVCLQHYSSLIGNNANLNEE